MRKAEIEESDQRPLYSERPCLKKQGGQEENTKRVSKKRQGRRGGREGKTPKHRRNMTAENNEAGKKSKKNERKHT